MSIVVECVVAVVVVIVVEIEAAEVEFCLEI
jgi:hypothetical protein